MSNIRMLKDEGVAIIEIARRGHYNSLDVDTAQDLRKAGLQMARDRAVRVTLSGTTLGTVKHLVKIDRKPTRAATRSVAALLWCELALPAGDEVEECTLGGDEFVDSLLHQRGFEVLEVDQAIDLLQHRRGR